MTGWLPLLAWAVGTYDLQSVTTTHPDPDLTRVEYRIVAGSNSVNHFSITHVERNRHCHHGKVPVILFTPFLFPGSFYEISESGSYAESAAGKLAADGYDLWLVGQRRTDLAPGACEQGTADCSVMADWDYRTMSDDGLLALSIVRTLHPERKPVVGGFSAGSTTTMALVNRAPHDISGAFMYEGTFYTEDPTIRNHNAPICQQLEAAIDAGQYYDASAQMYGPILTLAEADPTGISPIPVFPPGTTNQMALLYVFSVPPQSGSLSPTPNFIRSIADFSTLSFVYTNPARLFEIAPLVDNYGSLPVLRDLACGLAGVDASHYDSLGKFHGDLLMFVEGTGFGQAMFDTVGLFTHAKSVTVNYHPELGESDPYFHYQWQDVFYAPLKQWLDSVK
jgi:hypothetical protein